MTARQRALGVLAAVCDQGAYANLALKKALSGLEPRDAKWITALVYTTLDHILGIDYYLGHYTRSLHKDARNILRMGVCELLYMDTPPHAAINESVSLCRRIHKDGLCGFVNAVLRHIDRDRDHLPPFPEEPVQRLSLQYSYPAWLVGEWVAAYGEGFTEALLSAPPTPLSVRAQYPCSAESLLKELPVLATRGELDDNCLLLSEGLNLPSLPAFIEGRMSIQSQSAMLCCLAIKDACRGRRVLDACAAPGGKSAYLASLSENELDLHAWELHPHRISLLEKTLSRLHVQAAVQQRDAAIHDPAFDDFFDVVLLDAPCSGLGQTQDKPDIRYAKSDADIEALVALQTRLLDATIPYVRPGGLLLYATCTISRRENEAQAEAFLKRHPACRLEPMPLPIPNDGMLQLFPNVHHSNGFFMARFRKCI